MATSIGISNLSLGEKLYAKLAQAKSEPRLKEKQDESLVPPIKMVGHNDFIVTLSVDPKAISSLVSQQEDKVDLKSASNFRDFLKNFHTQLRESGRNSSLLSELPESDDPARLQLAKQAANYILAKSNESPMYSDASSENPFANLGRKTLSKISFDDSGAYTSAERFAAFAEIEHRDGEFNSQVSAQISAMSRQDENKSALWAQLIQSNAKATLLSEMSETERAFRGFGTEASERATAASLALETDGVKPPALPEYQNLREDKDSILATVTDTQGSVAWKMISVKQLAADSTRLELIEFASANKDADSSKEQQKVATAYNRAQESAVPQVKASRWLSLYATISAY